MPVMFDWDIFELGEKELDHKAWSDKQDPGSTWEQWHNLIAGPGVPLCFKFLSSLLSTLPKGHLAGTHLSAL